MLGIGIDGLIMQKIEKYTFSNAFLKKIFIGLIGLKALFSYSFIPNIKISFDNEKTWHEGTWLLVLNTSRYAEFKVMDQSLIFEKTMHVILFKSKSNIKILYYLILIILNKLNFINNKDFVYKKVESLSAHYPSEMYWEIDGNSKTLKKEDFQEYKAKKTFVYKKDFIYMLIPENLNL